MQLRIACRLMNGPEGQLNGVWDRGLTAPARRNEKSRPVELDGLGGNWGVALWLRNSLLFAV